jgi:phage gpG-like protein
MLTLPAIIGNEVVNFSKENFNRQGFLGDTFEPWRKRKSRKDRGRAILVKTARLKRGTRVIRANWSAVVVGNDAPYAKAHNDGSTQEVSVRSHTRNKFSSAKVGSGKFTKKGVERMKTVHKISGNIQVKAHKRRMRLPRRRFLGKSQYLTMRLKRVASAHFMKATK